MPRKPPPMSSSSSLSPPPAHIEPNMQPSSTKTAAKGGKRKAAATNTATSKRNKTAPAPDVEAGNDITDTHEAPQPKRRAPSKTEGKKSAVVQTEELREDDRDSATIATKKTIVHKEQPESENGDIDAEIRVQKTAARKKKTTNEKEVAEGEVKKVTKRKPKSTKNTEPLAERTTDTKLCVGAHVSAAGGVQNAIVNLVRIGGNAFALFLKNHRKWESLELDPDAAKLFIDGCKEHGISAADCCLPHGSYLVNLAHPEPARKKQAYDSFLNDLTRCNTLGIRLYNFHPGNANATTREEGLKNIAENLNQAHQDPATGNVITLLETMATLGNTIGGTFADLAGIIELVKDKSRVGVCLDTCHVFAAGYDLRSPEAYATTMAKFDEVIGLQYLKAFHVNDSKAPLFSNRDLHARIGTGYLGLRSFHNLVNDERFHGLPMVLETPNEVVGEDGKKVEDQGVWAREIKMLESLVGMDVESDTFKELEARLHREGEGERTRVGDQVERKKVKATAPKKKKKVSKEEPESEDEDLVDD